MNVDNICPEMIINTLCDSKVNTSLWWLTIDQYLIARPRELEDNEKNHCLRKFTVASLLQLKSP